MKSGKPFADRVSGFLRENSGVIMTGFAVAGTVGTSVLAVRATPEAHRQILDAESERIEPLTPLEKLRLVFPLYIPAALVGTATIGAIVGNQVVNNRRQAAIMGALAITETTLRDYREKAREVMGPKKDREVIDSVAAEHLEGAPMVQSHVWHTAGGDVLCFDDLSSRYFRSSMESIRKAMNDINSECLNNNYASLNEFYNKIGLPPAGFGEEVGWRFDNLMDLEFSSTFDEAGVPALVIIQQNHPTSGYHKIHG